VKLQHQIEHREALKMLHSGMPSHVFSHQQHDPFAFHHPQPQHPAAHQHANIQQYNRLAAVSNASASSAANALLAAAPGDQQKYGMAASGLGAGAGAGMAGASGLGAAGEHGGGMSEDDRKTMEWIVQLLNAQTRETALLELSKKREAVPELALVLWHSFGMFYITSFAHRYKI
jgi:CCR4-NOT transcription complex subunit 9